MRRYKSYFSTYFCAQYSDFCVKMKHLLLSVIFCIISGSKAGLIPSTTLLRQSYPAWTYSQAPIAYSAPAAYNAPTFYSQQFIPNVYSQPIVQYSFAQPGPLLAHQTHFAKYPALIQAPFFSQNLVHQGLVQPQGPAQNPGPEGPVIEQADPASFPQQPQTPPQQPDSDSPIQQSPVLGDAPGEAFNDADTVSVDAS